MGWPQRITAFPVRQAYEPPRDSSATQISFSRLMVVPPARRWYGTVMERLNALCSLPQGWNGYNAGPVRFDNANFALRMLESVCASDVPPPSIVPGPSGDLQVEWHLPSGDIELHVRSPNSVHAWRLTSATGDDGEEVELTNDFTIVGRWMKELAEPVSATVAAAA